MNQSLFLDGLKIMNNEPVAWMLTLPDGTHDWILDGNGCEGYIPLYTHPAKTLTNAVVNELWAESQEDGIAMQQGFTTQQHYFAHLILRKASE